MKSGMIDFEEYFPDQVRGEYYVVRHEITSFLLDPKKGYDDVKSFLQQEVPHLRSIRAKLGKTDMFYQKVSSYVVEACLQKIIPAVNDEQSRLDSLGLKYEAPNYIHFRTLKDIAKKSWAAYQIMDKMDMEYMFRYERYLPSRNTLQMICEDLLIETRTKGEIFKQKAGDSAEEAGGCLLELILKIAVALIICMGIPALIKMCS